MWKEQGRLELVTELSRELPSLEATQVASWSDERHTFIYTPDPTRALSPTFTFIYPIHKVVFFGCTMHLFLLSLHGAIGKPVMDVGQFCGLSSFSRPMSTVGIQVFLQWWDQTILFTMVQGIVGMVRPCLLPCACEIQILGPMFGTTWYPNWDTTHIGSLSNCAGEILFCVLALLRMFINRVHFNWSRTAE